ncbi:glutamate receptor U1 isoform X2 [Fopius arisanus]|uniref:Glutamate receptor U1 isoform X2 n=1 Tax=Fopius arisanus TaxID=64838 RepID=A0A9R1U8I2_9HYME|nr:PREDICTED: glutamate receptor U1-like isoform X2 [Fopius arisanus]
MWKCAVLVYLVASFVGGDRSDVLIDIEGSSWLQNEHLGEMIDHSFEGSRCCNVFVKGDNRALFRQFIELYGHDYTLGAINRKCYAYFLLAKDPAHLIAGIAKIPTIIALTQILVIVDAEITENSRLFNVSFYKNANVNIISRSGMWSLSEMFLRPRIFKNVVRPSDMRHSRGIVNLEGRQLQVATFYVPPLSYLSTSDNKTVEQVEGEFFSSNNPLEWDGVEVKLFMMMAKRLNFTWMIRKPNGGYRYGRARNSTWEGGMIGQLFRKEVDLAFGGIWFMHDPYRYVNLSVPWYQVSIHFLVPRPQPITNFWALTRPITVHVWIAVVTTVIVQSLHVWVKAWINPKVPSRFRSFANTLTELIGRLVGLWAPQKTDGLRVQLHLWHFAGLLIVTAYCSSLAARLTTPDYENRIDTPDQFLKTNLTWGREGPIPKFDDYFEEKYREKMMRKFKSEKSLDDRKEKIDRGNYAIVGRIINCIFFPENDVSASDLRDYRVMKEPFGKYYLSFATQPWLVLSLNKMMTRLIEHGFTAFHLKDVIHRRTSTSLREVLIERDGDNSDGPVPLKLKPLGAGFIVLFLGLTTATIVFYFEIRRKDNDKWPSRHHRRRPEHNSKNWNTRRRPRNPWPILVPD